MSDASIFPHCVHGRVDEMYQEIACEKFHKTCTDWKKCSTRVSRYARREHGFHPAH